MFMSFSSSRPSSSVRAVVTMVTSMPRTLNFGVRFHFSTIDFFATLDPLD